MTPLSKKLDYLYDRSLFHPIDISYYYAFYNLFTLKYNLDCISDIRHIIIRGLKWITK